MYIGDEISFRLVDGVCEPIDISNAPGTPALPASQEIIVSFFRDEPNNEFSIKSLKEYTNLSQANLMYHLNELQKKGFIEKVERRSL